MAASLRPVLREPRALVRGLLLLALAASAPASAAPPVPAKKPAATKAAKSAAPKPLADTLSGMARAEYEAGRILYGDRDFENASIKFQHAYDLAKDARLLWNIAACEKNLRRYTRMLATVDRYLAEGGALLTDSDRSDAGELVKTVRMLVSQVTLEVGESGAEVLVDDEKVGLSPLDKPLLVDAGTRVFQAKKDGFLMAKRSETLTGGTEVKLRLDLVKEVHEGRLVVECAPKDAVLVDGKTVGVGPWQGALPSGGHQLRVTAQGMSAYQSEIVLRDGETRRVSIALEPAKSSLPLGWLIGGAGVLVAGGVATAVVLATRSSAPDPVRGTIAPAVLTLGFDRGAVR
jgi:hypothetical protein